MNNMPAVPFLPGGGGGAFGVSGSPANGWTFTAAAQAGVAEAKIVSFGIADDATASVLLQNTSATDGRFSPRWITTGPASNAEYVAVNDYITGGSVDSGTLPLVLWRFSIGSTATAAATRPIWRMANGPNTVLDLLPLNSGANAALSWGTQTTGAPSFTTRSEGTRLVLRNEISGSRADSAIGCNGIGPWYSCPEATSSWEHRWYGGATNIMRLFGNGQLLTTAAPIVKLRVALTTPVTITTADHIVVSNLSSAGAVAVALPSAPTAGTIYIIKDGKGDAGANNITITPAAGTIDGAATLVLSSNYARATLMYNGTEWNRID